MPITPGKFERQTEARVFKYTRPELEGANTKVWLCRSDIMFAGVKVIREGGENNLHSHTALDGFWFVLSGRARFYGEGDKVIAELGKHEGVHIPRDFAYWFEAVGDEVLELLQVESIDRRVANHRVDHAPRTEQHLNQTHLEAK